MSTTVDRDLDLLVFDQRVDAPTQVDLTVTLTFEQRQKGRLRARADRGREVALMLERGQVLRGGAALSGVHGQVLGIVAQPEAISEVRAKDALDLTRAAYHLGNRHVALQVGDGWLRYLRDHVLDEMVRGLGLSVTHREVGFEPESGAYAAGHHHHSHSHD